MANDLIRGHRTPRVRQVRTGVATGLVAAVLLVVGTAAVVLWFPAGDSASGQSAGGTVEDFSSEMAAEAELAARPMMSLPPEASAPQPLAARAPNATLELPPPTGDIGGVPAGFPQTPPGAVAALAALTVRGLDGADPDVYARVYRGFSSIGAPAAEQARLVTLLRSLRTSAGLTPTGPAAGLTMGWRPLQGQVKGVLDDGRYVVACVLGQFSADYQGQVLTYGVGDCQAMRWTPADPTSGAPGQWRIARGPAAAPAPDAWPGSQDSINAGFQELR